MPSSAVTVFEKVFVYTASGTSWSTDTEIEAQSIGGTAFNLMQASGDFLYLGSDEKFDAAYFDVELVGSYTSIKWEYWNGGWTQIVPLSASYIHDVNVTPTYYAFAADGMEEFPLNRMSDWVQNAIGSPSTTKYWIRASSTTASTSTKASINTIIKRPVNSYCTTKDVFDLMQMAQITDTTDFTSATNPTKATVEDYIQTAQSTIEHRSRKIWRPHYVAEEYQQFNLHGMKPANQDVRKLLDISVWTGSDWESRTIGRDEGAFFVPETGMIHFSRFFILPARFTNYTGGMWRWGGGEFNSPVKISYIAGREFDLDPREAGMVFDAARKLSAATIIRSADFGGIAVGGMDRVMMAQRADSWSLEAEDLMDSLRAFEIF